MDLTLGNAAALRVAEILMGAHIIPIHAGSWAHYRQSTAEMNKLFDAHGLGEQLTVLKRRNRLSVPFRSKTAR